MPKPTPTQAAIARKLDQERASVPTADYAVVRFETLPPSKNRLKQHFPWRGPDDKLIARTTNTPVYARWLKVTIADVRQVQRVPRVAGPVALAFEFGRTSDRQDLDGLLAASCDLLVAAGVIDDDRFVQSIEARWAAVEGVVVRVRAVKGVIHAKAD
jgi:Holliday junction resolvase RusA-like endonuclease